MLSSRYSPDALKRIGEQNADRLPPATTCLAMYEYELKRAVEQESLFTSAFTQTARVAKEVAGQKPRIDRLARAIKECASHHDSERGISLSAVRSVDECLKSFTSSDSDPQTTIKRAAWLMNELDQEAVSTEDQVALTAVLGAINTHEAKMEHHQSVQHLRDDHAALAADVVDLKSRVSKLEDLVRALTMQKTAAPLSPQPAQLMSVTTSDGQALDLSVPKGKALVLHKPSRASSSAPTNRTVDSARESVAAGNNQSSAVATIVDSTANDEKLPTKINPRPNEKPLPPVPAARALPETVPGAKMTQSKGAQPDADVKKPFAAHQGINASASSTWDSVAPTQTVHKPGAMHKDSAAAAVQSWVTSLPNNPTMQPAQSTPQTQQQADTQSSSSVVRKGKTKWKDPPLFQNNDPTPDDDAWRHPPLSQSNESTSVNDPPKALFSLKNADTTAAEACAPSTSLATEKQNAFPASASPFANFSTHASLHGNATHEVKSPFAHASIDNTRKFGEISKVLHGNKQMDENKAPQEGRPTTKLSGDAMRNMLKAVTPQSPYATAPAAPEIHSSLQEKITAAPPAPAATLKSMAPATLSGITPTAPFEDNKASQPSKPFKWAKSSVIRKVEEAAPTTQAISDPNEQVLLSQEATAPKPSTAVSSAKPVASTPNEQAAIKNDVDSSELPVAVSSPFASFNKDKQKSASSTTSTVASSSSTLTPAPAARFDNAYATASAPKPAMNAQAPAFQHSATVPRTSESPFVTSLSASTNNRQGAFHSVVSKMHPAMQKQFLETMKSMQN